MTLDKLWALILFILNHEESGGVITPEQRNNLLSVAQQRYYSILYGEYERTQKISDSLSVFNHLGSISIDLNGLASLPTGYYHCGGISYLGNPVEIVTDSEYHYRLGSKLINPIALFTNNQIQFQPVSLGNVLMSYLKYPIEPYYDWYMDSNYNEIFLPQGQVASGSIPASNTVEYQWRYEDKLKIVGIILDMCGIYLNNDKVIQYSKMFGAIER